MYKGEAERANVIFPFCLPLFKVAREKKFYQLITILRLFMDIIDFRYARDDMQ